jgi:Chaperone of endosialidase
MSYIGNSPGVASQRVETTFTATASQTVFTPSSGYTLGYCDVYQNGVKLVNGDDYSAPDGVSITLTTGAAAGDSVVIVASFPRGLSDGYLKAEADAKYLTIANPSYTGTLTGGTGLINIGSGQFYKDTAGNIGVGVTPSAWSLAGGVGFQVKQASVFGYLNNTYVQSNAYFNSSWKYIANDYAQQYIQASGQHQWLTAASGTAGNTISFTQAMTLDASGNLLLGTTSNASGARIIARADGVAQIRIGTVTNPRYRSDWGVNAGGSTFINSYDDTGGVYMPVDIGGSQITFSTAGAEKMRLDTAGNLGLGFTPSSWTTLKAIQVLDATSGAFSGSGYAAYLTANCYYNGGSWYRGGASYAPSLYSLFNGTHTWQTAGTGAAGSAVAFSTGMQLSSSNLLTVTATNSTIATTGVLGSHLQLSNSSSQTIIGFSAGNGSGIGSIRVDNSGSFVLNGSSGSFYFNNDLTTSTITLIKGSTAFLATSGGACFQGNNSSTWSVTSDIRIKQNVRPVGDALQKMLALNPCHFEYKSRAGITKTGFIAQEFEQVFPGHVAETEPSPEFAEFVDPGEKIKGIDADMIPYLVKAIQEQQALIQQLQADVATLKGTA